MIFRVILCLLTLCFSACSSNLELKTRIDNLERKVKKTWGTEGGICPSESELVALVSDNSTISKKLEVAKLKRWLDFQDAVSDWKPRMTAAFNLNLNSENTTPSLGGFVQWDLLKFLTIKRINEANSTREALIDLYDSISRRKIMAKVLGDYYHYQYDLVLYERLEKLIEEFHDYKRFSDEIDVEVLDKNLDALEVIRVNLLSNIRVKQADVNAQLSSVVLPCKKINHKSEKKITFVTLDEYKTATINSFEIEKMERLSTELDDFEESGSLIRRWFDFNISTRLNDALNPMLILRWSLDLIDQGAHEREQLKIALEKIERKLKTQDYETEIIRQAILAWSIKNFSITQLKRSEMRYQSQLAYMSMLFIDYNKNISDLSQIQAQQLKTFYALKEKNEAEKALKLAIINYQQLLSDHEQS